MLALPTPETARPLWRDTPADDAAAALYLNAAAEQCFAYAPPLPAGTPVGMVPETWFLAIVMQARNIYNAGKAAPSGDFDGSGYGVVTFPLDWQVKSLLRPQRGLGAIV